MTKRKTIGPASNHRQPLKTEFPLSEKDEQARRIECMRKVQSEALKLWRA